MKVFRGLDLGAVGVLLLVPTGGATAAQTVSVTQRITIRATVAEAIYVIVDSQGSIVQIIANTPNDVQPKVYQDAVRKGSERALSPQIYKQYRALVPSDRTKIGVLYERQQFSVSRLLNLNAIVSTPIALR